MNKFHTNDAVFTLNPEMQKFLVSYLRSKNVPSYQTLDHLDFERYPNLNFYGGNFDLNCSVPGAKIYNWLSIEEFIQKCDSYKEKVFQLTADYEAELDFEDKVVKVDNQLITFNKIEEVYNLT